MNRKRTLESNKKIKINWDGGDLSSDGGLLLIKEFAAKIGLIKLIKKLFKTNDTAAYRLHNDSSNLIQVIYQIISASFEDDCADELTNDPVLSAIVEKDTLASQPTLSRFWNRMDKDTLTQYDTIFIADAAKWRTLSRSANPDLIFLLSAVIQRLLMQTGSRFTHWHIISLAGFAGWRLPQA